TCGYPTTAYLFTASQVLCHYSHWNKEWLLPSREGIPIHHITGLQPPPCSQLSTFRYSYHWILRRDHQPPQQIPARHNSAFLPPTSYPVLSVPAAWPPQLPGREWNRYLVPEYLIFGSLISLYLIQRAFPYP